MYQHLFGPVPSRRLGISLGIDLVPMKTCTLNCIYCECGPTTQLTLKRKEYVPFADVKKELSHYLSLNPKPDYITFSGSGEPTLNSTIKEVIHFIKTQADNIPVALLTNGTLLSQKEVREDIKNATVIIPSLDAATEKAFAKIVRPHPNLSVETIINGLIQLRKEYAGQIWLEIFIVPKINDTKEELTALKSAIEKINPDQVQLNTLDRPGTIPDIAPASYKKLKNILDFWQIDNAEIIAKPQKRKTLLSYRADPKSAIMETVARRPCTIQDLVELLGLHAAKVNKHLEELQSAEKIITVKQKRGFFYKKAEN
jgi:wyosine [tRNA(Phe)-imidazoG37] synthetase (radical SAM superfamily)